MEYTEKPLVEVLDTLRARGYTEDFNLLADRLSYHNNGIEVNMSDIVIDRIYRFYGYSDVSDEMILYAMTNRRDGFKGVLLNSYGAYSSSGANAIIGSLIEKELNPLDNWGI